MPIKMRVAGGSISEDGEVLTNAAPTKAVMPLEYGVSRSLAFETMQ